MLGARQEMHEVDLDVGAQRVRGSRAGAASAPAVVKVKRRLRCADIAGPSGTGNSPCRPSSVSTDDCRIGLVAPCVRVLGRVRTSLWNSSTVGPLTELALVEPDQSSCRKTVVVIRPTNRNAVARAHSRRPSAQRFDHEIEHLRGEELIVRRPAQHFPVSTEHQALRISSFWPDRGSSGTPTGLPCLANRSREPRRSRRNRRRCWDNRRTAG